VSRIFPVGVWMGWRISCCRCFGGVPDFPVSVWMGWRISCCWCLGGPPDFLPQVFARRAAFFYDGVRAVFPDATEHLQRTSGMPPKCPAAGNPAHRANTCGKKSGDHPNTNSRKSATASKHLQEKSGTRPEHLGPAALFQMQEEGAVCAVSEPQSLAAVRLAAAWCSSKR
jgi:hypothetical protein